MRSVLLMRHAKSSWKAAELSDHDRPLNKRGLGDVPRMAEWLQEQSCQPDWCLSSTAVRASATATGLREACKNGFAHEQVSRLYLATAEEIVNVLRELPDEVTAPLIVAHNPGLQDLVMRWSGLPRRFPTASLVGFRFPDLDHWRDLSLDCQPQELFFISPKVL